MNVVAERNLFINTSTVINGNGRDITINLPQGYADCAQDQSMKMALTSFMMEKKFYNINDTNRRFFMTAFDPAAATLNLVSRAIQIPQGNYRTFGGQQALASGGLAYDPRGLGKQIKDVISYELGFTWDGTQYQPSGIGVDAFLKGSPALAGAGVIDDLVIVEFQSSTQIYTITINLNSTAFGSPTTLAINDDPEAPLPAATYLQFDFFSFELAGYRRIPNNLVDKIIGQQFDYSFTDTHELLGGCSVSNNVVTSAATKDELNDASPAISKLFVSVNAAGQRTNRVFATLGDYTVQRFQTSFQASLRTTEAVYLRTDLPCDNFQTASFDSGGNLYPYVIKSDILAKIPLPNPLSTYTVQEDPQDHSSPVVKSNYDYQLPWEYITFVDDGSIFTAHLNTTHLSQMRIFLTDDKGRLLPYESETQRACNEMYFSATLKIIITQNI